MVLSLTRRAELRLFKTDIDDAIGRLGEIQYSLSSVFKEVAYAHEDADTKYVEGIIKEKGLLRKVLFFVLSIGE